MNFVYHYLEIMRKKCSISEGIKTMWYTYTMECYTATKKNAILAFVTT